MVRPILVFSEEGETGGRVVFRMGDVGRECFGKGPRLGLGGAGVGLDGGYSPSRKATIRSSATLGPAGGGTQQGGEGNPKVFKKNEEPRGTERGEMEGRERHNKGGMPQPLLDGLNPAQRKAATHPGGALLILAGAGTGKTRTITRRVAHLVSSCGVAPGRILAITFTNKAAKEMRNRIAQVVPSTGIWVSTFHATCARMLRQDAEVVGRTRDFSIQDVDDRRKTLRRIIKDQGWDPMIYKPRKFEQLISNWKQRRMDPGQAAEEASLHGVEAERCALVYEKYEKVLRKTDSLDFDDLFYKYCKWLI